MCVCVRVRACVRARACARVCVSVCVYMVSTRVKLMAIDDLYVGFLYMCACVCVLSW